jgi:hypothetical protein
MMTCREVSTLLATGELPAAPLRRRAAVRLHLAMCRHCAAFKRWLDAIGILGATSSAEMAREAPADLEARTIRRIDGPLA